MPAGYNGLKRGRNRCKEMKKKESKKKKFGVVSVLLVAGLLVSPCGIAGARSELATSNPAINFTHVPEYPNPGNEDLRGKVTGVAPDDYRVAVYISVGDLWWTKPTYASPLTTINPDGTWRCDITTGGNDRYATVVAAYLLPAGVEPPMCGPCHEVPGIPEAVAHAQELTKEPRTISFADHDWEVKMRDFRAGPGPNYFSDKAEDVWVDEEGLHLTISERDGNWYCTEVILDTSFGYGTYSFQTHGRVDIIDPMMVLGLFTWDGGAKEQNYREMDIEFARWGNAGEYTNAQYVVQPCSQCPGCGDRCTRFRVNLTDEDSDLTHYFVWNPGTVEFRTYYGNDSGSVPQESALVHNWTHSSEYVPEPGNERIRFNFWLHGGNAPTSSQGDEVIITTFSWQPPIFPEQFDKDLVSGWNLVSLPLTAADMTVSNVIDTSLSGSYDGLYKYDAATYGFESLSATDTMENGVGYFIHLTSAHIWTYNGSACTSMNSGLQPGLNMVGWLNCSKDISDALNSIEGNYCYLARWNAVEQEFEVYEPAAPGMFNDFETMDRGEGYFISMKTSDALSESC